jgi:hypothetical protein
MAKDKCNILEQELCESTQKIEQLYSRITSLRTMLSTAMATEDTSIFL